MSATSPSMPLKSSASWVNKEISLSIRGDTTVSAIWPLSLLQGNVYHKNSASCFSSFLMSVLEVELTRVSDESVGLELEKNYGVNELRANLENERSSLRRPVCRERDLLKTEIDDLVKETKGLRDRLRN
uniref:Uncharacterized protein n=1 Tax=Fagus sylvatica TaxID=28930 RepID=A0A2N9HWH3_FAGSY